MESIKWKNFAQFQNKEWKKKWRVLSEKKNVQEGHVLIENRKTKEIKHLFKRITKDGKHMAIRDMDRKREKKQETSFKCPAYNFKSENNKKENEKMIMEDFVGVYHIRKDIFRRDGDDKGPNYPDFYHKNIGIEITTINPLLMEADGKQIRPKSNKHVMKYFEELELMIDTKISKTYFGNTKGRKVPIENLSIVIHIPNCLNFQDFISDEIPGFNILSNGLTKEKKQNIINKIIKGGEKYKDFAVFLHSRIFVPLEIDGEEHELPMSAVAKIEVNKDKKTKIEMFHKDMSDFLYKEIKIKGEQ